MLTATERCDARERCVNQGDYAVFASRETNTNSSAPTFGYLCLCANHWLVVPKRPCTGIESMDTKCIQEVFWEWAWKAALEKGFDAQDLNGWATLLNPVNSRSQHQMHFRVASFQPDEKEIQNDVVKTFRNQTVFSTEWKRPTISW